MTAAREGTGMEEFVEDAAGVLEVPGAGAGFEFRSSPVWGSMAAFGLCLLVERRRGRPMPFSELEKCRTIADVAAAAGV